MKALSRVALFYVVTFIFTIILGGVQQAAGIAVDGVVLPQLAPGLAALVMLAAFRKDRVKLTISVSAAQTRTYAVALGIPAGVTES